MKEEGKPLKYRQRTRECPRTAQKYSCAVMQELVAAAGSGRAGKRVAVPQVLGYAGTMVDHKQQGLQLVKRHTGVLVLEFMPQEFRVLL